MEITLKELRKLQNKVWDMGQWRTIWQPWTRVGVAKRNARYRDVTKIIKEFEKTKEKTNV